MVTDIWELDRFDYSWLTDAHPALRRNYTANDIEDEMKVTCVFTCHFVKSNHPLLHVHVKKVVKWSSK
jgi:hypothetical protein